jgi:hypothetical protein
MSSYSILGVLRNRNFLLWVSLLHLNHITSIFIYPPLFFLILIRGSLHSLDFFSQSHYNWRSVSRSVLVSSPVWGSWPDISSLWKLLSCPYGAPSLTRGRVCRLWQSVISSKSVVSIYIIQYIYKKSYQIYVHYVRGLCQSRLGTADYALCLVATATTAV